jgi:hypothetical protein
VGLDEFCRRGGIGDSKASSLDLISLHQVRVCDALSNSFHLGHADIAVRRKVTDAVTRPQEVTVDQREPCDSGAREQIGQHRSDCSKTHNCC